MHLFIEQDKVSLVTLSLELEQATMEHTLEDNERIYVSENGMFPFWIRVYPRWQLISFRTYLRPEPSFAQADRYIFCNRLNGELLFPALHVYEDRLYADHAISYRDGLICSQFIRMCRAYVTAVDRIREELVSVSNRAHQDEDSS